MKSKEAFFIMQVLGIKQSEVCEALGVDRRTVTRWTRGETAVPARFRSFLVSKIEKANHDLSYAMVSTRSGHPVRVSTDPEDFQSVAAFLMAIAHGVKVSFCDVDL